MNGDSSFARVDYGPMSLASFGMIAVPSAVPCKDDALVNRGAEAPKPCLSPGDIRTTTTAGGLLPTGTASAAMMTIFSRPLPCWTLGEKTKRIALTNFNQFALPYWRKVIQTKSRQTLVFDPGGCSGRLRGCPFLGGSHTLLSMYVCMHVWSSHIAEYGSTG